MINWATEASHFDWFAYICHDANKSWWLDIETGQPKERNVGELLMLMVSELAEAMEGDRQNLKDTKLPDYDMLEVELVDCAIRIFDFLGAKYPNHAGKVFAEKMQFNAQRADHKIENRKLEGGKKY